MQKKSIIVIALKTVSVSHISLLLTIVDAHVNAVGEKCFDVVIGESPRDKTVSQRHQIVHGDEVGHLSAPAAEQHYSLKKGTRTHTVIPVTQQTPKARTVLLGDGYDFFCVNFHLR